MASLPITERCFVIAKRGPAGALIFMTGNDRWTADPDAAFRFSRPDLFQASMGFYMEYELARSLPIGPCPRCRQVRSELPEDGQGGEYPCPTCGIPTLHDTFAALSGPVIGTASTDGTRIDATLEELPRDARCAADRDTLTEVTEKVARHGLSIIELKCAIDGAPHSDHGIRGQVADLESQVERLVNAAAAEGGGATWKGEMDSRIAALENGMTIPNGAAWSMHGVWLRFAQVEERIQMLESRVPTSGAASERLSADRYRDLDRRLGKVEGFVLHGPSNPWPPPGPARDRVHSYEEARSGQPPIASEPPRGLDVTMVPVRDFNRVVAERDTQGALAEQYKGDHLRSCEMIAQMHAAAMGKPCGAVRGVVEDIAHLRTSAAAMLSTAVIALDHVQRLITTVHRMEHTDLTDDALRESTAAQRLLTHVRSQAFELDLLIDEGDKAMTTIAATEEPAPISTDRQATWDQVIAATPKILGSTLTVQLVIEDMRQRDTEGRKRYGTPLTSGNGRRHLVDAYQEHLDGAVYLAAWLDEHGHPVNAEGSKEWTELERIIDHQFSAFLWRLVTLRDAIDAEAAVTRQLEECDTKDCKQA